MLKPITLLIMLCFALLASGNSHAEIRLDLDATSIIGNRELPRIVYLVAWRDAPKGDILDQSLESNHDTKMFALDRDVFKRQISYHELLFSVDKDKK